jgi:23S rRNA A1618 N6-methylase RlmF
MPASTSLEERAPHGRHLAERSAMLMHPRNPYKSNPPDFAALARFDPAFAAHVRPGAGGSAQIDWGSPEAVVALTRSLLWQDFGLRWHLPPGRLCPTVPSRLNYLLWLQDLIASRPRPPAGADQEALAAKNGGHTRAAAPRTTASAALAAGAGTAASQCRGQKKTGQNKASPGQEENSARPPPLCVDVGTGASAIYALLGAAVLGWDFIATEMDAEAAEAAGVNVKMNGLETKIDVRRVGSARRESGEEGADRVEEAGRNEGDGEVKNTMRRKEGRMDGATNVRMCAVAGGGQSLRDLDRERVPSFPPLPSITGAQGTSLTNGHPPPPPRPTGPPSCCACANAAIRGPLLLGVPRPTDCPDACPADGATRPPPSNVLLRPTSLPGCCACANAAIRGPLLLGVLRPTDRPDACMCNPPFYDTSEQPRGRADLGEALGVAAPRCAAVHTEMFTPGGEVGFVSALIDESLFLGRAVGWYSSLVGRKASLAPLIRKLDEARVPEVCVCQPFPPVYVGTHLALSFASAYAVATILVARGAQGVARAVDTKMQRGGSARGMSYPSAFPSLIPSATPASPPPIRSPRHSSLMRRKGIAGAVTTKTKGSGGARGMCLSLRLSLFNPVCCPCIPSSHPLPSALLTNGTKRHRWGRYYENERKPGCQRYVLASPPFPPLTRLLPLHPLLPSPPPGTPH